MAKTAPNASAEITAYINGLPEFARLICEKLRSIILAAVPGIIEDWKWGPNYYSDGLTVGYSGFKKHAKLTFFNGSEMKDPNGLFNHCVDNEFSRSIKFTDVSEINEKLLTTYIRESAAINAKGFKRTVKEKIVEVPEDLKIAFSKEKKAVAFFDQLTAGYRKEYVEWIASAKQATTRADRIAKTVQKCKSEERLNDKYKSDR
ncbi:YdeI/OmpD-associated family protein [Taibaiella soli]|nr:YdeI/OmpD-associated family protein [Taibaiella soli]